MKKNLLSLFLLSATCFMSLSSALDNFNIEDLRLLKDKELSTISEKLGMLDMSLSQEKAKDVVKNLENLKNFAKTDMKMLNADNIEALKGVVEKLAPKILDFKSQILMAKKQQIVSGVLDFLREFVKKCDKQAVTKLFNMVSEQVAKVDFNQVRAFVKDNKEAAIKKSLALFKLVAKNFDYSQITKEDIILAKNFALEMLKNADKKQIKKTLVILKSMIPSLRKEAMNVIQKNPELVAEVKTLSQDIVSDLRDYIVKNPDIFMDPKFLSSLNTVVLEGTKLLNKIK